VTLVVIEVVLSPAVGSRQNAEDRSTHANYAEGKQQQNKTKRVPISIGLAAHVHAHKEGRASPANTSLFHCYRKAQGNCVAQHSAHSKRLWLSWKLPTPPFVVVSTTPLFAGVSMTTADGFVP
jgi:hypothetical protein